MFLLPGITGLNGPTGPWKKRQRPCLPPHVAGAKALAANKVKARRKLHKAFLRWFAENRHRFAIDIKIEKRLDEWIEFGFVGINPAIRAYLMARSGDLEVRVEYGNQSWDIIADFCAWPEAVKDGYLDSSLLEEARQVLPSRRVIWELGIFKPLLDWVNGPLALANWIEMRGEHNRWSNATLLMTAEPDTVEDESIDKTDGAFHLMLPCRV